MIGIRAGFSAFANHDRWIPYWACECVSVQKLQKIVTDFQIPIWRKMLKFKNFLCCLKLETGGLEAISCWDADSKLKIVAGYVVGWLTLILNVLALIALSMAVVGLSVQSCEHMAETVRSHLDEHHMKLFNEYCPTGKTRKSSEIFTRKKFSFLFFQFSLFFLSSLPFSLLVLHTSVGCVFREHRR